jgi:twitching motility protein PilI
MGDWVKDADRGEPTTPWLSPSEALTRFVPERQARREGTRETASIRFGFRVGSIGLLVPSGMLAELVQDTEIYRLPTTPAWFWGLTNLRGNLVPVFDLKRLFAIADQGADEPNLLVLGAAVSAVGVLIDGRPQAIAAGQRLERLPPLPPMLHEHSRAAYAREREIWVDFDLERFFRATGNLIADCDLPAEGEPRKPAATQSNRSVLLLKSPLPQRERVRERGQEGWGD